MRALPALEECASRLEMIFPRAAFDTVLSNPLAAAAVAAMIYVDAIVPDHAALPTDDELVATIDAWRDAHMSPGGRMKALTAQQREQRTHAIRVELPDGEIRSLEPGEASVILKGVIEAWAPARLADPVVLTISE